MADPAYDALMRSIGESPAKKKDDPAYDALMRSIEGVPLVEEPSSPPPPVQAGVDPIVGEALDRRDTIRTKLEGAVEKALFPPQAGGAEVPAAAMSSFMGPDVRGAIKAAEQHGFVPPKLGTEYAAEAWRKRAAEGKTVGSMTPEMMEETAEALEEEGWGEKIRSFLGSVPETALMALPGKGRGGAGKERTTELIMGAKKADPKTGRTIHRPTVVSTVLDVAGAPQRVLVTAPVEIMVGDRPDEAWWQTLGHSFKFPSWSSVEPRDNVMFVRRTLKELGHDPDSWWGITTQIAAGFADPGMALGGPVKPAAVQAATQATRAARRGLLQIGVRGQALDQSVAAFSRNVSKAIQEAGDLGRARPVVRDMIADEVGDHAAAMFDDIGLSWGDQDITVGLPLLRGREKYGRLGAQPVLATAEGVGKAKRAVKAVAQKVPGADLVGEVLAAGRRAFDPAAPPAGTEDAVSWGDYYRLRTLATLEADHIRHVSSDHLAQVSEHYSRLPAKVTQKNPAANPVLLSTGDFASWSKNPALAAQAESEHAMAVINQPMRRSTERWGPNQYAAEVGVVGDGTLVPDPSLTGGALDYQSDASRLIRQGYAKAQISGEKGADLADVVEGFGAYVESGLLKQGWAQDAAEAVARDLKLKVPQALTEDIDLYGKAWKTLGKRLENMVEFHRVTEAGIRKMERSLVHPLAKKMAAKASAQAKSAAGLAGMSRKKAAQAGSRAARKAYQDVMAKIGGEIDNHFTHILRNRDSIARRIPAGETGMENVAAHRKFVDVIENYEHGQDPVTDLLVTTAARVEAHAKFRSQLEVANLIASDARWARPHGPAAKGLRNKAGWHDWQHPITGEMFKVRQEVIKDFDRVIAGYKPGGIDALFRTVAEKAPWLGYIGSGWKGRVTHGRPWHYNVRNAPDDMWRMWMGGYDGSLETAKEGMKVGLIGHLEAKTAIRKTVKKAHRRPQIIRDKAKAGFDNQIAKMAQGTIRRGDGSEEVTNLFAYRQAAKYGIVDKGFVPMELTDPMVVQGLKGKRYTPLDLGWKDLNPFHKDHVITGEGGFYLKTTGNASRRVENMRRLTAFISGWKRGDTWEESAHNVAKYLFNYGEQTDFVRKWVKPIIPFSNFTLKAIPAHWKAVRQHPSRYLALARGYEVLDEMAEDQLGPISVVADYIEDQDIPRLPMQTSKGSDIFLGVGLSFSELNFMNPMLPGADPMKRTGFFDDVSPVFDLGSLMMTGRDPRTGRMLANQWSEPDKSLMALVDGWNASAGKLRRFKVPKKPRVRADGSVYHLLPASMVWTYEKWLPNVVTMTNVAFPKDDPFAREKQELKVFKEATGLSAYANNPIKAESRAMDELYQRIAPSVVGVEDEPKQE